MSKKGNGRIRRALHLPAFNVVRYKLPQFFNLYSRTLNKHGIKMKSYVAVQKKLLAMVYTLWKRDEEYISTREKELEIPSQQKMNGFVTGKVEEKSSADHKPALHKVINRRNVAV